MSSLPTYRFQPHPGDAYGFYFCAKEILATTRRDAPSLLAVAVVAAGAVAVVFARTRSAVVRALTVSWGVGALVAVVAAAIRFTGAPQMGWPLVWSVPLAPVEAIGRAGPNEAFAAGLAISLVCNALTVLATFVVGKRSGLTAPLAVIAAWLVSLWPFLSLLTGPRAAANGTWQVWLGLSLYTEPVSTAAVVGALALLLDDRLTPPAALIGGFALGFATFARNSDVLILAVVIGELLLRRRWSAAKAVAAGAAAWAPASLLYWPKGYPRLHPPAFPRHPFELSYVTHAWSDSYLWHPGVLAVLVPVALLGVFRLVRPAALMLVGCVAVTAAFYSFYAETPIHPRFLYVAVPAMFVLWTAGADAVVGTVGRAWQSRSSQARAG